MAELSTFVGVGLTWNTGTKKIDLGKTTALVWDDANNRIGLGIALPTAQVHLVAPAASVTGLYVDGTAITGGVPCVDIELNTAGAVVPLKIGVSNGNLGFNFVRANGAVDVVASNILYLYGANGVITRTTTTVNNDIATPAGGSSTAVLLFGTTAGFGVYYGTGAPSALTAGRGSIYLNATGSGIADRLYVNTTGGTVWTNFVSAA